MAYMHTKFEFQMFLARHHHNTATCRRDCACMKALFYLLVAIATIAVCTRYPTGRNDFHRSGTSLAS